MNTPGSKSTVVVSLRSRGLSAFSSATFLNWRLHLINLFSEVSDTFVGCLLSLYLLSWLSWTSLLITMIVIGSNIADHAQDQGDASIYFPFLGHVVLPLLLVLYHLMVRRDNAQAALGRFRVAYVAIALQSAALTTPSSPSTTTHTFLAHSAQRHQAVEVDSGLAKPGGKPAGTGAVGAAGTATAAAGAGSAAAAAAAGSGGPVAGGPALPAGALPPLPLPPLAGGSAAAVQPGVSAAAEQLANVLLLLADDLHRYCVHKRPYARHLYPPYKAQNMKADTIYKVSREVGLLSRRLQRTMREVIVHVGCVREALSVGYPTYTPGSPGGRQAGLNGAPIFLGQGGSPAVHYNNAQLAFGLGWGPGATVAPGSQSVCSLLGQNVTALHTAVEELMAVKEAGTPVLLRSMLRWMVAYIVPVFMSWYWLGICRNLVGGPALGGILAVVTQLCLLIIMDTTISLEDPFDEVALNAVSMSEAMNATAMMCAESDGERLEWLQHNPFTQSEAHEGEEGGTGTKHARRRRRADSSSCEGGNMPLEQQIAMPPMPPPPAPAQSSGTGLPIRM